jgi:hypothetical protein
MARAKESSAVSPTDRSCLLALIKDRNSLWKRVWRGDHDARPLPRTGERGLVLAWLQDWEE